MKNGNMVVKSEKSVARNPQAILNEMMKTQPEGGEITLDQFARKAGITRLDAVEFLQSATGGCFVIGRRGHRSRFLHGIAFDKFRQQEETRREWRKKNGLPPNALPTTNGRRSFARVGRPLGSRNKPHVTPVRATIVNEPANGDHLNVGRFSLEVDINGQKAVLPLTVELVPTI
jgi:hypothetical protein